MFFTILQTCIQPVESFRGNLKRKKSLQHHLKQVAFQELQGDKILAKYASQQVKMARLAARCCKA